MKVLLFIAAVIIGMSLMPATNDAPAFTPLSAGRGGELSLDNFDSTELALTPIILGMIVVAAFVGLRAFAGKGDARQSGRSVEIMFYAAGAIFWVWVLTR